jgi:Tol biopolymer transport system component
MAATNAGIVLGTAAYMSPEQARGRAVDRRSDIFAFGCVLYEMLTGRPTFAGEDVTEILGRVVTGEPDLNQLPVQTPSTIRRMIQRALKKDPRQRLGDIRDVRFEIEDALNTPAQPVTAEAAAGKNSSIKWIVLCAATLAASIALAIPALRYLREIPPAELRLDINTPATSAAGEFALSPDGKYIAFIASGEAGPRLWLRPLDKTDAQPLQGTDGAEYPFWSADSRSIGFFAGGKLWRIDIAGGRPQTVAGAPLGRGGAWNADGTIIFAPNGAEGIRRVAATGGDSVSLTRIEVGRQTNHRFPRFLPDGQNFLFSVVGIPDASGIYLGSLDGGTPKRLTAADSHAEYLEPDMIVFLQQDSLFARHLDLKRRELTGDPVLLANSVGADVFNEGNFSVSAGRVAYRSGNSGRVQLTWFDRSGKLLGTAAEPDNAGLQYPEISPDGRRVAVTRTVNASNFDIFVMELMRAGSLTRFTFDPGNDLDPIWSPNGMRIVFASNRSGNFNLYAKASNSVGAEELVLEKPSIKVPQSWSSDGRFLLFYEVEPKTGRDLWALDLNDKTGKTFPVANTEYEETLAQFSPDGRWIAYQTNASGRFEIVVQTFPEPTGRWQISTNGGVEPRWRSDGKELYFISPDAKLMAAPVKTSGSAFEAETPVALFQTRILGGGATAANRPQYDVSRDGKFLINQPLKESAASPITLILNWKAPAK